MAFGLRNGEKSAPTAPASVVLTPEQLEEIQTRAEAQAEARWRGWAETEIEQRDASIREREAERTREQLARLHRDHENERDALREQDHQRIRQEYLEKYEGALDRARGQLTDTEARLATSTRAYTDLLDGLLPLGKTRNLGRHTALDRLDLVAQDAALALLGYKLVTSVTDSAYPVRCVTEEGEREYHRFTRRELQPQSSVTVIDPATLYTANGYRFHFCIYPYAARIFIGKSEGSAAAHFFNEGPL